MQTKKKTNANTQNAVLKGRQQIKSSKYENFPLKAPFLFENFLLVEISILMKPSFPPLDSICNSGSFVLLPWHGCGGRRFDDNDGDSDDRHNHIIMMTMVLIVIITKIKLHWQASAR